MGMSLLFLLLLLSLVVAVVLVLFFLVARAFGAITSHLLLFVVLSEAK